MTYFSNSYENINKKTDNVKLFSKLLGKYVLYDLGASGGTPPPFKWLGRVIHVVNFEPDPRAESEKGFTTFNYAIGPESMTTLYLNRRQTTSSLLPPNRTYTDLFDWKVYFGGEIGNIFETVNTVKVETRSINHVLSSDVLPPDFMKVDVQGLSYEVFRDGGQAFETLLGALVEVEFHQHYQGQYTFSKTHELMLEYGFEIFEISNLNRWYYKTGLKIEKHKGQHQFCDFLYIKSIDSIKKDMSKWNLERTKKLIGTLLLFDLNDAAAAYYEFFVEVGLIPLELQNELIALIEGWQTAVFFFNDLEDDNTLLVPQTIEPFNNIRKLVSKLLDVSPRKIIAKMKSLYKRCL